MGDKIRRLLGTYIYMVYTLYMVYYIYFINFRSYSNLTFLLLFKKQGYWKKSKKSKRAYRNLRWWEKIANLHNLLAYVTYFLFPCFKLFFSVLRSRAFRMEASCGSLRIVSSMLVLSSALWAEASSVQYKTKIRK